MNLLNNIKDQSAWIHLQTFLPFPARVQVVSSGAFWNMFFCIRNTYTTNVFC